MQEIMDEEERKKKLKEEEAASTIVVAEISKEELKVVKKGGKTAEKFAQLQAVMLEDYKLKEKKKVKKNKA